MIWLILVMAAALLITVFITHDPSVISNSEVDE